MPHPSDDQLPSDYPALSLPDGGFKSNIPKHLLEGATPSDKWIMEELSKNTQATEFCMRAAVEANALIRQTNGRLRVAESQLLDHEDDIGAAQADVAALGTQCRRIKPLLDSLALAKAVAQNKLFWIMTIICAAFLLRYNRHRTPQELR